MLPVYVAKKLNFAMNLWTCSTGYSTYSSRTCAYKVTELLIGLQLDVVPLITTLSAQQSNPTILISSPHIILSMKMLCYRGLKTETLIKIKRNIHLATHIYQASNFVTKGYDIDQAWFPVSKSMLIVSNNPHVLNRFGNGFQSYVFHPLPWDRGEAKSAHSSLDSSSCPSCS